MISASEFLKWMNVFGLQSGGGGGGTFGAYQVFWVSSTAAPGGNGSIAKPFTSVVTAYEAGVLLAVPFVVVVMPGTYDETATPLALVNAGNIFGYGSAITRIDFGNLTLDQTSWTTSGPNVASAGFYGFTATSPNPFLAVPALSSGNFILRDFIPFRLSSDKWVFQNFTNTVDAADCDLSQAILHFYGSFVRSPGCYFGAVTASTYNVDTLEDIGNARFEVSQRIDSLFGKAKNGNTINLYVSPVEATDFGPFEVDGDTINVFKSANVIDPTVISGTPTITNLDQAANVYASGTRSNYTPTSATTEGNLQGIDAALAISVASKVYVTGGYQLVAPNTVYYTQAPGKVVFQIPVSFPRGSTFTIVGAAESQRNWELWTQLGQSLIYQDLITDLAPNIYATARSNYYRDTATFTCITADTEIQCIEYDGAGLTISQETAIDIPLTTVTALPRLVYAFGKIISAYSGYLAKLIRTSDNAVAYGSPDFANRLSMLSPLNVGSKLIEWSGGVDVEIQMLDQSGNANDATDSGQAFFFDGNGQIYGFNGRSAFRTNQGGKYLQAALPFFSNPEFTLLSYATRDADSDESSIATLYAPGNGDDFSSALDNVCFYENIPNTSFTSLRNGNLSTKAIPALNTPMLLTNLFDGANNTISVNRSNGTSVASSGSFSFDKLLMGGRYVSGGITQLGNYRISCMLLYATNLSGPEISDLLDYIELYL